MKTSSSNWVTRVVALVLCLFITLGVLAITFGVIAIVPIGSGLWLKNIAGIQFEQGSTLASFKVSDLVVLIMVWVLPSLVMVGVALMVLRKIFHIAWKYVKQVLSRAFAKQVVGGKEQEQDEHSVAS